VGRRKSHFTYDKLKECIIPDFMNMESSLHALSGYDACFYCAGISSSGMSEAEYSHITYDTVMHFATQLSNRNPRMIFCHVSGAMTNSSEKGKVMWARVKGKAENNLMKLPFKAVYNFRPGFMKATYGQKNIKGYYKFIGGLYPLLNVLFPNHVCTIREVGEAMINSVLKGYPSKILEVKDIRTLAKVNSH
jgi:uncharacterized protein YbjT (DUF2867 family)